MPEFIPVNSNVHFKSAFDITSEGVPQLMTYLRQKLRAWCIRKFGDDDETLHRAWFYVGNNPRIEPCAVSSSTTIKFAPPLLQAKTHKSLAAGQWRSFTQIRMSGQGDGLRRSCCERVKTVRCDSRLS